MAGISEKIGMQLAQVGEADWGQLVDSMRGAIEDRSHVMNLGIAVGVVVVIWVNWSVAKWVLNHFNGSSGQRSAR
jgi:hypothetical protein